MPFIAHTEEDIKDMLESIGCASIEELFKEIPKELQVPGIEGVGTRMTEMQVSQLLQARIQRDATQLNFIGAGCYEHYIPALVWDIATRGEFLTSYTPYQAEASQGTLQVLYEFQSMLANLTALDVSNASMYDGASSLAEAILMAVRCAPKDQRTVLLPSNIHPYYRQVVRTIVTPQNIEIVELPFDPKTGQIDINELDAIAAQSFAALVIAQPNFFGVLDHVDQLTDLARQKGGMVIGLVNPLALGLLTPPGVWGKNGADIACGEAQSLGVPLASGGPYIGFLCCKQEFIRQLPGRLVGMTTDLEGKRGFTLTLQAREQHIRRAKATSNICTNQGLLATVVTIYLSLMGAHGLRQVAAQSHASCAYLKKLLAKHGIETIFNAPFFNEILIKVKQPVAQLQDSLAAQGIQAGFDVSKYYPALGNALLCCVTETKTNAQLEYFVQELVKC